MAWYDSFVPNDPNLTQQDRQQLARSGLLQAGLSILANNSAPGVTPIQAISGGILGGLNGIQQGAKQIGDSRYEDQQRQFKAAQQQDQMEQMQKRQKIQDLALQFAKPDGTFDMQGYQQAVAQFDPQTAMELHQNELRNKLTEAQTQQAQAQAKAKQTRTIDSGTNQLTQEMAPDGSWHTIATAPRFAPQTSVASALAQQIDLMKKYGATDADIQSKLGIGAANANPNSWDDGLTEDQKNIAQGIANYSYPISSRFLQTKANQQLVARAQMLNPDLNIPQYKQNEKLLSDLASSNPNSAGGGIQALNTAATHVAEMADLSKKLPDGSYPLLNKAELKGSSMIGGSYGNTLKAWDTAKQLFAGEMAKAVKGGVASMQEVEGLEQQMDAAGTPSQRAAALQATANFLNDRAQAAQDRRDQILGSRSPGTSLFTKRAQDALRKVYALSPDAHVPDFGAPSQGLGYKPMQPAQAKPASNGWSIEQVP